MRRATLLGVLFTTLTLSPAEGGDLVYKERFVAQLAKRAPAALESFDPATGRFGKGIWIVTDQNVMLPLAVLYTRKAEDNPYYQDAKLLDVLMKAGDALIDDMDANGQWEFRKKDGSTWGQISMPWTYSRWIRTYALIKNDMPPERRGRWVKAFEIGFAHIAKTQFAHVHNIPAHLAMALYAAGKELDRPEWCEQAAKFLHQVTAKQAEGGYWSEGEGPVVNYNFVYIDALGTYYLMSGDKAVLPAIEKAVAFHAHFTYPSGQAVETIDQRNPYGSALLPGNPAFTLTPEGRAWIRNQWQANRNGPLSDDATGLFILHGQEGPVAEPPSTEAGRLFVMRAEGEDRAATLRQGPWFIVLSAYTTPVSNSRWHQDRQNVVSIWHEKTGVIIGGGNTKLQPAWSNFTVGDPSLLRHKPGDENPVFKPKGELYHVPTRAALIKEPVPGLDLTYGPETCRIRVGIRDDRTLEYTLEATTTSGKPVLAHLTLLPRMQAEFESGAGRKARLTEEPLEWTPEELCGMLTYAGCRLTLPKTASLHWPALPHNPYRKDGRAEPSEGRIVLRIPFDSDHPRQRVLLEVVGTRQVE